MFHVIYCKAKIQFHNMFHLVPNLTVFIHSSRCLVKGTAPQSTYSHIVPVNVSCITVLSFSFDIGILINLMIHSHSVPKKKWFLYRKLNIYLILDVTLFLEINLASGINLAISKKLCCYGANREYKEVKSGDIIMSYVVTFSLGLSGSSRIN